ncbi:MAG: hypothetical protein GY877_04160 [Hyphomicrobium sp.]|nr:hypothetical protein [Hyphomicrobium sp.]
MAPIPQEGRLRIEKQTIGGDADFDFVVKDSNSQEVASADDLGNGDSESFDLPTDTYTIQEVNIPAGWTLQSVAGCGALNSNVSSYIQSVTGDRRPH